MGWKSHKKANSNDAFCRSPTTLEMFFFLGGGRDFDANLFFLKNRHNGWNHQIHDQFDKQVLTEMKPLQRKEVKEWDDLPLGQAE